MITPIDGMTITENVTFKPGQYFLPNGIKIAANGITVNGNGAEFIGNNKKGTGITINNCTNVIIKNFNILKYYHGIRIDKCSKLTVTGNQITLTAEIPSDTIFLDIWLSADKAYGSAIWMHEVSDTDISNNNLEHNMCGVLTYNCQNLHIKHNLANYCSGFGFHLYKTCDSCFEDNRADYCCRYNVRNKLTGIERIGHMGADATGFLILVGSHRNIFRRNYVRMGGDGFFLAGMNPSYEITGANDNVFVENDGSWSPNIAFEATFSRGNIFKNNLANHCNYGFWLGFSSENTIENNTANANQQAGIAVENGWNMTVKNNTFKVNRHGVLLWSNFADSRILKQIPETVTSHDWKIHNNTFLRNTKAITIAENHDHGIRPLKSKDNKNDNSRPYNHRIYENKIDDNRVGIDLHKCDNTIISKNIITNNPEANIREYKCIDTIVSK